jgi:hypothetical protein
MLEYLVRLLDMLVSTGSIERDIDMIELEVIGVNGRKSHRLLLLDFVLQEAHGPSLINFD